MLEAGIALKHRRGMPHEHGASSSDGSRIPQPPFVQDPAPPSLVGIQLLSGDQSYLQSRMGRWKSPIGDCLQWMLGPSQFLDLQLKFALVPAEFLENLDDPWGQGGFRVGRGWSGTPLGHVLSPSAQLGGLFDRVDGSGHSRSAFLRCGVFP